MAARIHANRRLPQHARVPLQEIIGPQNRSDSKINQERIRRQRARLMPGDKVRVRDFDNDNWTYGTITTERRFKSYKSGKEFKTTDWKFMEKVEENQSDGVSSHLRPSREPERLLHEEDQKTAADMHHHARAAGARDAGRDGKRESDRRRQKKREHRKSSKLTVSGALKDITEIIMESYQRKRNDRMQKILQHDRDKINNNMRKSAGVQEQEQKREEPDANNSSTDIVETTFMRLESVGSPRAASCLTQSTDGQIARARELAQKCIQLLKRIISTLSDTPGISVDQMTRDWERDRYKTSRRTVSMLHKLMMHANNDIKQRDIERQSGNPENPPEVRVQRNDNVDPTHEPPWSGSPAPGYSPTNKWKK